MEKAKKGILGLHGSAFLLGRLLRRIRLREHDDSLRGLFRKNRRTLVVRVHAGYGPTHRRSAGVVRGSNPSRLSAVRDCLLS